MGILILVTFVVVCFAAPILFWRLGYVSGLTVIFWVFFGVSALINACVINTLQGMSTLAAWMSFVGPAIVLLPFAFMIYKLERGSRKPVPAAAIAFFGSVPVTLLWTVGSTLFMRE